MLEFKQFLKEVFDNPAPYEHIKTTHNLGRNQDITTIKYAFEINDNSYHAEVFIRTGEKILSVDFALFGRYELSGLNTDQYKVFSTIFNIMKDVVEEYDLPGYTLSLVGWSPRQDQMYRQIYKYLVKNNFVAATPEGYLINS